MRFIILILVCFILAAAVIFFMSSSPAPVSKVKDDNFVLVAATNLTAGSFIKTNESLKWVDLPEGKYPEEEEKKFIRKLGTDFTKLEGAVVRRLIVAGEPVNREKIVTPGEGGFMSAVLYPGMRAISVGVNIVSGNAGFIFPGDRVDVLLTHSVLGDDGRSSFVSETIVESVRVLAIDQQITNTENKALIAKTVTLEVSPKEAEEVLVASELGKISLVLRSNAATNQNNTSHDEIKTYTRDSDVSKILQSSRTNGEVTVTRGK